MLLNDSPGTVMAREVSPIGSREDYLSPAELRTVHIHCGLEVLFLMRGDEMYDSKIKYGISIDIRFCSDNLFQKKKES